jgi:adenylate cyclase
MNTEIDRKIAVIFATDVVGYSKHMEANESETVNNLRACEKLLRGVFDKHKGRLFNTGGDSFLAEFPSAVAAVECAVEFQESIIERNASDETTVKLQFRIGINSGDVIKEKDNLLGDGVNIAARLEALAQINGITVSKVIYDFVKGKTQFEFNDIGIQKIKQNEFHAFDLLVSPEQKRTLKQKSNSILVFAISFIGILVIAILGYFNLYGIGNKNLEQNPNIISDKPSILITNFKNITGDPANNYLGDGITSNIIATLNKSERFEVPPSSTVKYIQKNELAYKEVKEKYGIEFIVTGNIQGNSNKLRVTAEMVDIVENVVIWSEIYDFKKADDIFEIQDAISLSILKASRIKIDFAPAEPVSKNAEVYKMHLRAGALFSQNTPDSNKAAQELFETALSVEPQNHRILNNLAWIYWQKIYMGISKNRNEDIKNGLKYANASLLYSPNFVGALSASASLEMLAGNYEKSCKINKTLTDLVESIADRALGAAGQHFCGNLENAITNYEYVLKKAPHSSSWVKYLYGYALTEHRAYDKALDFFETELQKKHSWSGTEQTLYILSAFIKIKQGKEKEAYLLFEKQRELDGKGKTAKRIKGELFGLRNKTFLTELLNTLAPLGLPDN